MNYGHPPHKYTDDDVYIFDCKRDGWSAPVQAKGIGAPFYCPSCGQQVSHFVRYNPNDPADRAEADRLRGAVTSADEGDVPFDLDWRRP